MAASGIAEHNEARRKERTLQKIAYRQKLMRESMQDEYGDSLGAMPMDPTRDTYANEVNQMRNAGSPPGMGSCDRRHDAAYVDHMRRQQLRQEQLCEYSAKIPKRFTSVDYVAQW